MSRTDETRALPAPMATPAGTDSGTTMPTGATDDATETTSEDGSGFGVLGTVVAIGVGVLSRCRGREK